MAPRDKTPDPDDHWTLEDQGARLKAIRDELGLHQRDIADAAGVGEAMVGHWEHGRRPVPRRRAIRIAAALGVHPSEFMGPDWIDLDVDPVKVDQDASVDHRVFVQRRLEAHSDALRRLEAMVEQIEERAAATDARTEAIQTLLEQQAIDLLPLVTELLSGAADRRQSEEGPPGSGERRASVGRRRIDQLRPPTD